MPYNPILFGVEYIVYIGLTSQATGLLQANPTIAAGDFRVSKNGGALANLATLPSVVPAGGTMVKITVAATEMDANNVTVVCRDAVGAEWADYQFNIQPEVVAAARGGLVVSAGYQGDISLGTTIDLYFATFDRNLTPASLDPNVAPGPSTAAVVSAYRNNSAAETVAGITLTTSFDGVAGINHVRAVLTVGNGYAVGDNISFVITNGSIASGNVPGLIVGSVTIQARVVAAVTGAVGSVTTDSQPSPTTVPLVGDVPSPYQTMLMVLQGLSSISNNRTTGLGTVTLPDGTPYYEVQTNDGENPVSVTRVG